MWFKEILLNYGVLSCGMLWGASGKVHTKPGILGRSPANRQSLKSAKPGVSQAIHISVLLAWTSLGRTARLERAKPVRVWGALWQNGPQPHGKICQFRFRVYPPIKPENRPHKDYCPCKMKAKPGSMLV